MGSAATEEVPPEPGPRDLRAEAAVLIDQAGALLMQLTGQPENDRLVSELVMAGVRFGQLATALDADAAARLAEAGRDDIATAGFDAGRAYERKLITQERKAPGRHAAARRGLRVVQGIAIAGVALREALRHSWAAHPVATAAAGVGTAAVLTATVAVAPNVSLTHPFGASPGTSASAPGWEGSASPVSSPSQRLIAAVVTKPKADAAKAGKLTASSSLTPSVPSLVLPSATGSSASAGPQPGQDAPAAPASPAGPATLSVSMDGSPDLSVAPSVTVTISASGSGWATWKVDAGGSDLDFSAKHGVLQAGQSATITVTSDAVQDGAAVQTIDVAGTSFTITLPLPPAPVVSPTDLPTILPTDPPTAPGN